MINGFFLPSVWGVTPLDWPEPVVRQRPRKGQRQEDAPASEFPEARPVSRHPDAALLCPEPPQFSKHRKMQGDGGGGQRGGEVAALTSCPGPGLWDRRGSQHKILEGKAPGGREDTSLAPWIGGRSGPSFGKREASCDSPGPGTCFGWSLSALSEGSGSRRGRHPTADGHRGPHWGCFRRKPAGRLSRTWKNPRPLPHTLPPYPTWCFQTKIQQGYL